MNPLATNPLTALSASCPSFNNLTKLNSTDTSENRELRYTAYLYNSHPTPPQRHPAHQTDRCTRLMRDQKNYYLLDNETFGKVILGGGSGASIYTVESTMESLPHSTRESIPENEAVDVAASDASIGSISSLLSTTIIPTTIIPTTTPTTFLRKLMPMPGAVKQNREALGEVKASGFHPLSSETMNALKTDDKKRWKIESIMTEHRDQIDALVNDTRAKPIRRGVIYEKSNNGTEPSRTVAAFYDMALFQGREFGKVIANDNQPLTDPACAKLADLQMDLLNRFLEKQQSIYWEPVATADPAYQVSTDFFWAPVAYELLPPLNNNLYQGLTIQGTPVEALLLAPTITVNGETLTNPLHQGRIIDDFKQYAIQEQTLQVHGDLQQTNQFLLAGSEKLMGIDYRAMDIVPSYAELSKALWGAEFVPGMEDMWNADNSVTDGLIQINLTPKSEHQQSIRNFTQFSQHLHAQVEQHDGFQAMLERDPDAKKVIQLSKANQYLRDVRILLPRLMRSDCEVTTAHLEHRLLFDLSQAALQYQAYQHQIFPHQAFQQEQEQKE